MALTYPSPRPLHERRSAKAVLIALLLARTIAAAEANTLTVTNGNDDGTGSLRQAIADAVYPGDTIEFAPDVSTVTLYSKSLEISSRLNIKGPGAKKLTIRRGSTAAFFRMFYISFATTTLSGLTITGGDAPSGDGRGGGGIYVEYSSLTISDCLISGNKASTGGGIGSFDSTVTLKGCTIAENSADFGGGIYHVRKKEMSIARSTIARNSAAEVGGGIYNTGQLTLLNSTIASNTAHWTGGIVNSTGGSASIVVRAKNTIIARNTGQSGTSDYDGPLQSMGFNLIGNTSGITAISGDTTGNQTNVAPMLGALRDNGGPTPTIALLLGSPAIDAGNSGTATMDQRRRARPVDDPDIQNANGGDRSDIGAFEMQ